MKVKCPKQLKVQLLINKDFESKFEIDHGGILESAVKIAIIKERVSLNVHTDTKFSNPHSGSVSLTMKYISHSGKQYK